jgi:integrase
MKQGEVFKRCACSRKQWARCEHPYWHSVTIPLATPKVNRKGELVSTKQQRESLGVSKLNDAREARNTRREHWKVNGAQALDKRATLNDVAKLYAVERVETRREKDHYLGVLRTLVIPGPRGTTVALGEKRIDDITTADIRAAERAYRAKAKAGKAGGVVGVRKLLQTARHLFKWSIVNGHTKKGTTSPFKRDGEVVISVKPGKARKRRLVGDEEDRLLAVADPDTKDRIIAQLETGCRPGEVRTLQWSEVRGNRIVILADKAKDREERTIRITSTLQTVLDARRKGPDGEPLPDAAYVFGNAVGELVSKEKAGELWRATCKAAKVEDLTMHDLRRTFGSRFLEAGNDMHTVRDVLGHSSVTVTNTYLATEDAGQAEAFAKFERRKIRRVV